VLLKNNGINKLVLVVNKMDDPTVQWDKARWVESSLKGYVGFWRTHADHI
jgi:peptide chain release factor subunit 3